VVYNNSCVREHHTITGTYDQSSYWQVLFLLFLSYWFIHWKSLLLLSKVFSELWLFSDPNPDFYLSDF